MKRIKIFLASSIDDLREDRLQVGDFFRQLNEIYLDSGVHFSLIKCEDYDNSIAAGGKQQQYDQEIRESELVFFLFFRKVGDYTRHEFEVALEAFKDRQKPKIVTYFKYITSMDEAVQEVREFMQMLDLEIRHYYNTYGHIDTLKLGILMQIKLLQLDSAQINLEDGEVRLNGQPVVKAENVPLLHGNQTLRELTEKQRQLQAELNRCRSDYLADPTPEKDAAFFDTSAELNRVSKQLIEVEQGTMALLTTVAEMTSDGRVLTHRQKEAPKYFNQGDYTAVQAILEDEERENELRRAQLRAEVAKNEIQGYVEEELLLIKTEKAQGLTEARVKRILTGYRKVAELVEAHGLNKTVLVEYADFLYHQNRPTEAISVAEKLSWYYANPSIRVKEEQKADLYNLLGNLYDDIRRYDAAEEAYRKAFEIYTCLAERNPEAYEPDLAMCYNNLGLLYYTTQRYAEAEEACSKAVEIFTRLAERNPEAYESVRAACCNNLGLLYSDIQRYDAAEEAYSKAVEIYTRLAAWNPEAYESDLATCCNNLGLLYSDTHRYGKAEEAYRKAFEIFTRLAERNPEAYEPDLAGSYNNLGNLYNDTGRYDAAEKAYSKAVKIYTRLAERNPEVYESDRAACCRNLDALHRITGKAEEVARKAEEAFRKEMAFNKRLAAGNTGDYESNQAKHFFTQGMLYTHPQYYGKAVEAFGKAVEIYTRLAARNPEVYEPDLARSYASLGFLYEETQRYEEAQEAYGKAAEIYTRLAARNPETYEPEWADILWNLAELYQEQKQTEKVREVYRNAQPLFEKLAQKNPKRYREKAEIIRDFLSET